MEAGSGLSAKADQAGFAIAYPDATVSAAGSTQWSNYFSEAGFARAPPDDVGFLRALVKTLEDALHPDPKRIYFVGVSNGGLMTYRVGIELSDIVAAIGVVEGTLYGFGGDVQRIPRAVGPVSVLIIHGDQDATIPYCANIDVASQEQTFDYWAGASANGCSLLEPATPLCDGQAITAVSEKKASHCAGNAEVQLYKLVGGVHAWYLTPMNVPGQVPYNPAFDATTGVTTPDILWSFFDAHPAS